MTHFDSKITSMVVEMKMILMQIFYPTPSIMTRFGKKFHENFTEKIKNARDVGAEVVIFINNQPENVHTMSIGRKFIKKTERDH